MMMASKTAEVSLDKLITICFSVVAGLCPMGDVKVEAGLNGNEALTAGDPVSEDSLTAESSPALRTTPGWEEGLLGGTIFKPNSFQKELYQSQSSPFIQLKSPGKLPGIEFGVEMHSLQAFQIGRPAGEFAERIGSQTRTTSPSSALNQCS